MRDDIDIIDLDNGRQINKNRMDTVARYIMDQQVVSDAYPLDGQYVSEAGEMMDDLDGYYEPAIVGLKTHSVVDDREDREAHPTLVFVNRDEPDDIIVIVPMDGERF